MYTQIPRSPSMDEIMVRITAELLASLALATKELMQGQSSESVLADLLP